MKNLLLCLLAIIINVKSFSQSNVLNAQKDTLLTYSETVSVDGVLKNDFFIRARDWLSNNCKTLKIQDKEAGELTASGSTEGEVVIRFLGTHAAVATFDFSINIIVKDGAYKFFITNVDNTKIDGTSSNGIFGMLYKSKHCTAKNISLSQAKLDEAYQSLKDGFDKTEKEIASFLKSGMENKSKSDF